MFRCQGLGIVPMALLIISATRIWMAEGAEQPCKPVELFKLEGEKCSKRDND